MKKPNEWKDTCYREAVLSLPCCIPGCQRPSNGHHSKTRPDGQKYGLGQKAPDYEMFPLCRWHHQDAPDSFHNAPGSFRDTYGDERVFVDRTQSELFSMIPDEYWEWVNSKYVPSNIVHTTKRDQLAIVSAILDPPQITPAMQSAIKLSKKIF